MMKLNEKMVTDNCLDQVCGGKFEDADQEKYKNLINEYYLDLHINKKISGNKLHKQLLKATNLYHEWERDNASHNMEDFKKALYSMPIEQ